MLARLWVTFDTNADGGISREDLLHAAEILKLRSYRSQRGGLRRVATLAPVAGVQEATGECAGSPAHLALKGFHALHSDHAQASAIGGVTQPSSSQAGWKDFVGTLLLPCDIISDELAFSNCSGFR